MKPLSLRVYVITTTVPELGRTHEDITSAAIVGGADVIQFRDKETLDDEFEATARRLLTLCRSKGVPLIINDRVEIAAKIGADGVHVGHEDFVIDRSRIRQLRQMWGTKRNTKDPIIGVSARNLDEALALSTCGADYLGVGPIFATGSKADASEPIGTNELRRICRAVTIPVVAIGGITADNLPQVIQAGATGAAVIAVVAQASDMKLATETLQAAWKRSTTKA